MRLRTRIKLALIHRADQGKQNLMILMTGAGTFLIGFLLMNFAEYFLLSSVTQELIALLGLILAIVGVIIAAFGYICLSFCGSSASSTLILHTAARRKIMSETATTRHPDIEIYVKSRNLEEICQWLNGVFSAVELQHSQGTVHQYRTGCGIPVLIHEKSQAKPGPVSGSIPTALPGKKIWTARSLPASKWTLKSAALPAAGMMVMTRMNGGK